MPQEFSPRTRLLFAAGHLTDPPPNMRSRSTADLEAGRTRLREAAAMYARQGFHGVAKVMESGAVLIDRELARRPGDVSPQYPEVIEAFLAEPRENDRDHVANVYRPGHGYIGRGGAE